MYRIGIVSAVDVDNRKARVHYPDDDIISDWLPVINHSSYITLELKSNGLDWTVTEKHASANRKMNAAYTKAHPDTINCISPTSVHKVNVKVYGWLPFVGQVVLCIYNNDFNGDGIIIGGLT